MTAHAQPSSPSLELATPDAKPATTRPRFQAKKKRSRARIVVAVMALATIGAVVFVKLRPTPVTTTQIVRGTAVEAVYATGTIEPFDRVIVKSRAVGTIDLRVREGAQVKKGDLLAVIDAPALRHDLARGKADSWAASQQAASHGPQLAALEAQARAIEADLSTVRADRARATHLVASGSVGQADVDRLADRARALEAQLEASAAQRAALRIDLTARASASSAAVDSLAARLADAEVRSPIDGVVLSRSVEPGEVAMVNSPLLKLGTTENLILECAIDEADIGKVAPGKKVAVSLYAFPDLVVKGEVFGILPDADRAKKSFLAKVKIASPPPGLRSGMTGEVNVIIEERADALLAPAEAVDATGGVLVVTGGHVERRSPRLGARDMLRVEVLEGLADGDEVVVAGAEGLADGARVKAMRKPPVEEAPRASRPGMSL